MIIAVDFDGTVVKNRYPEIGAEIPYAIECLRALQLRGHHVILWTCRCAKKLDDALNWLRVRGIVPDGVNAHAPENLSRFEHDSRKVFADVYIDDRNIFATGPYDWQAIFRYIINMERRL